MGTSFIRYVGLHKAFAGNEVLRGVDLNIPRGETVVVLGGSGSGKSVLLRHAIGLHQPDAGSVWVDDEGVELALRSSSLWRSSGNIEVTYEQVLSALSQEGVECRECSHLLRCAGYFKCPDPEYSCESVKVLLDKICEAAEELASDLARHE